MSATASTKGNGAVKEAVLVTSGDLRLSANQVCWPAQAALEKKLDEVFAKEGAHLKRAFPVDAAAGHGFIGNQRQGMDIFETIDPDAPLVFATAAWQYTHHVLPGLRSHRGPILTVANWSGQWPGLVGMLNLNGSLVKAGVPFSTAWSVNFEDEKARGWIREWIRTGHVAHDLSHVRPFISTRLAKQDAELGASLAAKMKAHKAIMGIFDEGCMGMFNAVFEDDLLNAAGIFKERLSQSALVAKMRTISKAEAEAVYSWLVKKGVKFAFGPNPETDLTEEQVLEQCKMYIAAMRIAHEFGCDVIGIQYQQGLKDMVPASDLAEGLLNNLDRPPVMAEDGSGELYAGAPLPNFNEVDEGAGVDELITNRVWTALKLDPSTTLHDVRWGEDYDLPGGKQFVWVFQISGAAPANHLVNGYAGATSERQAPMYFRLGGGTLNGVGRPGEIVWSRVFVEGNQLHADLGRGSVVLLADAENKRRWSLTTKEWPMVNAVLHGVSRDQFMARHRANHINVAYAPTAEEADRALAVKAAMLNGLGIHVHLCGDVRGL